MELFFNIAYKAEFGESLVLNMTEQTKEGQIRMSPFEMDTADGEHWQAEVTFVDGEAPSMISYSYSVNAGEVQRRCEWLTIVHRLELSTLKVASCTLYDRWTDIPEDSYLYSSAFTECINKRMQGSLAVSAYEQTVRLVVRAPQLRANERLAISGAGPYLGNWAPCRALPMTEHYFNEWCVDLDARQFAEGKMEFKFVVLNDDQKAAPMWEDGSNRVLLLPRMGVRRQLSATSIRLSFPSVMRSLRAR